MNTPQDILTIQKFIYLLDDFHYTEFHAFLKENGAGLPSKLIEAIRKQLPNYDTYDGLCIKVYGSAEKKEKQNFNQLTYYTFGLTSFLAQNYPAYLLHNIDKIQRLVNDGRIDEANLTAKLLLDIADKVEDFPSLALVLRFLIQQAYLFKDLTLGSKYTQRLLEVMNHERMCYDILAKLRTDLNISLKKSLSEDELQKEETYFLSLAEHPSLSVRLLGKYAYVYMLYYFKPEKFSDPETFERINELGRELDKNGYLVFFFMFDIKSNFSFYKLNSVFFDLSSKEGKKDIEELTKHYSSVKFWKNYLNIPQILALTIKSSHYISAYHYQIHRKDYYNIITEKDLKDIHGLIVQCENFMSHKELEKHYKNDFINIKLNYCALLTLAGGENIKKAILELEGLLVAYQQINLMGTIDSIFVILMIGYFSLKDYDKCADTYKRYKYIVKDKSPYEDNDIGIHTYYYLSKWLETNRQQYIVKLRANYQRTFANQVYQEPKRAMEEFAKYFKLELQ